ncbi:MAG: response regulator [Candidatus Marinimicrobia bacterium]|nr:response regulator [Candidatus Neomarinimicrobiota bacterium]
MTRILIADDNVHVVDTIAEILMMQNYVIEKAYDGQEAVEKAKLILPDLILLDIEMPLMNGIDVCRTLRSYKKTQLTPIVILTGLQDTGILISAIEAGCDDFLSKPVDIPVLQARVESLLKMRRLRNQIREKEKFEYMINNMSEGIVITDESGIIQSCNTTALKMFKLNSKRLPDDQFLTIIDKLFKWKPIDWFALIESRKGEFTVIRKESDFKVRYALKLRFDTLINPFSEVDEVIFIIREETEQINEDRRKDLLVSMMTHKFSTIESLTLMNLESLQLLIKSPNPELKTDIIKGLRESSRRMTTIMKSLLQFLNLPESFKEKRMELIDEECFKSYLTKIKVELGIPRLLIGCQWVNISSFHMIEGGLYRILFELIENAIKFGNKENLDLNVSVIRDDNQGVRLSVFNCGSPIPQEELNRVWDRFYQVDQEFTGQIEGIGLGLSIVQYIIGLSEGSCQIFSDDEGTRVELYLPFSDT